MGTGGIGGERSDRERNDEPVPEERLQQKLGNNDVKLKKWGAGRVSGNKVDLPVSGGSLDPTTGLGTVDNDGGFKFKHGKRTVPVTDMQLDSNGKAVYAEVAGARMKFGFLSGVFSYFRNGFGVDVKTTQLKLTGKAARRINNRLDLDGVFRGGNVMSNSYAATQPSTVTVLAQNGANLVPDPRGAFAKFPGHGINPLTNITPIAPATRTVAMGGLFYTFPISGGAISPSASAGTVNAGGGIQITKAGGNTVQFNNLSIDFTTRVVLADNVVNGVSVGRTSIADLDFTGATITSDPIARTVTVTGLVVRLQALSAAVLNQEFPTLVPGTEFAAGDSLGAVSFTAQTQ